MVFAVAVGTALTVSYQLGQIPADQEMFEGIEVANFSVELDRLVLEDLEMSASSPGLKQRVVGLARASVE